MPCARPTIRPSVPPAPRSSRAARGERVTVDLEIELGDLQHVGARDRLGEQPRSPMTQADFAVNELQRLIERDGRSRRRPARECA
jgi:hypothetical protein